MTNTIGLPTRSPFRKNSVTAIDCAQSHWRWTLRAQCGQCGASLIRQTQGLAFETEKNTIFVGHRFKKQIGQTPKRYPSKPIHTDLITNRKIKSKAHNNNFSAQNEFDLARRLLRF